MAFHAKQLISAKLQRLKHKDSVEGEDVRGFQGPFGGVIILETKEMANPFIFVLEMWWSSTQCTTGHLRTEAVDSQA
ncbi:rCG61795 [Rattus norvegicus]|uniref:RCG61795 n=1 Tax=Rattus norvegicus TaxID=10116 RepID=A6HB05_RAT|nr:rCG61795 [Rattus norvegicus]